MSDLIPVTVLGLLGNRRYRAGLGPFKRGQEYRLDVTQKQYEALRADPYLGVRIVGAPPAPAPAPAPASVPECNEPCKGDCCEDCPCPAGGEPAETVPPTSPLRGSDFGGQSDALPVPPSSPKRAVKTAKKAKSP